MIRLISSAVIILGVLTACSAGVTQSSQLNSPYTDISVNELQGMLENKDFPLINVHIPFEGDLPDTDLSIPFNEIEKHLDQLPAEKDARIVLYCRSGNMSSTAAQKLASLGYTEVYNLEGGFIAWERAGLPVMGR